MNRILAEPSTLLHRVIGKAVILVNARLPRGHDPHGILPDAAPQRRRYRRVVVVLVGICTPTSFDSLLIPTNCDDGGLELG